SRQNLDPINRAIDEQDGQALDELLESMHAADVADLIEQLTPARRRAFLQLYSGEIDGEILSEIDESIREEVIEQLPHEVLTEAVREMDSDDVVDLIEDMEAPEQQAILAALDDSDRAAVERSLTWPEYSAGRLMQSEVVTAPEHWTVGEAIDFLRAEEWLPRSEEHTSELQSREKLVCRLLLEKKKTHGRACSPEPGSRGSRLPATASAPTPPRAGGAATVPTIAAAMPPLRGGSASSSARRRLP